MSENYRVEKLRRLGPFLLAMSISALAGMIFPFLQGIFSLRLVLGGAVLGVLITAFLAFFENVIYARRLRQLSLKKAILLKAVVYSSLVTLAYLILSLLVRKEGFSEGRVLTFQSVFTFSLVASLIVSSFVSISRILGQNELILLLLGRYHKPVEERRVVMFLDLADSTTIAEEIGSMKFLNLLNDFFCDLTGPILETQGEIYKYVGDEVIVTWKASAALKKGGNCFECFFRMQEQIQRNSQRYLSRYDRVPSFRAGMHYGTVIIGEMGDFKKEIAILGDTVNTTARVISEAAHRRKPVLVSHSLRDLAAMSGAKLRFTFEDQGSFQPKGKNHEIQVFTVDRARIEAERRSWIWRLLRRGGDGAGGETKKAA